MHPNSPGYDKKCSLRHPVSQPSPSGDADSIEEIKGLFAMLNLGHLRAMETPNTDVIIAAAWLRSHDAKVSGQVERFIEALTTLHLMGKTLNVFQDEKRCLVCDEFAAYKPLVHKTGCVIPFIEDRAAIQESPSDT